MYPLPAHVFCFTQNVGVLIQFGYKAGRTFPSGRFEGKSVSAVDTRAGYVGREWGNTSAASMRRCPDSVRERVQECGLW